MKFMPKKSKGEKTMNKELLLNLRKSLDEKMKNILANADKEKGLSEDEAKAYDEAEAEFEKVSADLARIQRSEAREDFLNEPQSAPIRINSGVNLCQNNENEYKRAFLNYINGRANAKDKELLEQRAIISGVDKQGGYLVPKEFQTQILEKLQEQTAVRAYATTIKTQSERLIPIGIDTPEFGWIDELGTYPETSVSDFGQVKLGAHKTGGVIVVSREILQDAFIDVEKYIIDKMVKGIANTEDKAFINGDGNKKPTGLITSASVGVIAASTSAITVAELIKLKYSVPASYRKNAVWVISDSFASAVENLLDKDGYRIWQPSMSENTPDRLLGYPVVYDKNMDGLEAGKIPALFGDLSFYTIADRGEIFVQVLKETEAKRGAIGILVDKRVDGILTDTNAVKTLKMGE